jgi:hypothetical protein
VSSRADVAGGASTASGPPAARRSWGRLRDAAPPVPVWVAAALLLLVTMLWAAITPGTRAPDEVQHLNSILRLADGGGWPEPGDAGMEREVLDVRDLSGATRDGRRTFVPGSVNRTPTGILFPDLPPTGVDDRVSLAELDDGTPPTDQIDQMTQHPPGYYAVTAVLFEAANAEHWRYDRALFFLRFLTGLAIAASVPFCLYLTTRDLTGRRSTAQAAAFLPLLIPQLGFVGGAVTNDGLTIAMASVLVTAMVRLMTAGPAVRRLLFVAVAAGAVCWTKGTGLTLIPAVPIAIAVAHRRFADGEGPRRWGLRFLRDATWVSGLAFVLGGWWWGLNIVRYGKVQPSGYETPSVDAPVLSFVDFFEVFRRRISASFFGDIGLLEAPFPETLTRGLTLALLALLVVGLWSRRRMGERVVLLATILLTFGVLLGTTYGAHRVTHNLPGLQGRYLFVLLVPLLALVAVGLDRLVRLVRIPARWLLVAVPVVGLAVAAAGLLLGFETYYLVEGQSVGRALDVYLGWAAWSWAVMAALVAAAVLACCVLAYALGREADAADGHGDDAHAEDDRWDDDDRDDDRDGDREADRDGDREADRDDSWSGPGQARYGDTGPLPANPAGGPRAAGPSLRRPSRLPS